MSPGRRNFNRLSLTSFLRSQLLVLVLGSQLASALPRGGNVGPNKSAYTHHSGIDGGVSRCTPLTIEQAIQLPGWPLIEKYARDTYGDDGLTFKVNPKEQSGVGATVCVDQNPIIISLESTPSCSQSTTTIQSTMQGTSGSMDVSYVQGYTNTGTWTVMQESFLGLGSTLTALFAVPNLLSLSNQDITTATFNNTSSNGFSTVVDKKIELSTNLNTPNGKTCAVSMTTTTCTALGKATVQYTAGGMVWLYYDKMRPAKSDPKGEVHYQWAMNLEGVIEKGDRTSFLTFNGVIQMESSANLSNICI